MLPNLTATVRIDSNVKSFYENSPFFFLHVIAVDVDANVMCVVMMMFGYHLYRSIFGLRLV